MPTLEWESKEQQAPVPAELELFSIVYPGGNGYISRKSEKILRNQVILGDNLAVMSALLPEFEGKINLIYADPPFFSKRHYKARIGQGEDSRRPQDWHLAEGYTDDWTDIEAYLDMLYPRIHLMHQLLASDGTLYMHLDWHANSYVRLLLDEIFGHERLLNEIIWVYHGPSPIRSAFNRKHDTILVYTKSKKYTFNVDDIRQPYNPNTFKTFNSSLKAGFGKMPDLERGKVPEDWWYFPVVARLHSERTGYPTQKPAGLLERIIKASSNPGDLVADFFCGAGTTAIAAYHLGRRYFLTDNNWRAIHTTRKRLVNIQASPFSMSKDQSHTIQIKHVDGSKEIRRIGNKIHLEVADPSAIDYWELDPNWNGEIFHSAGQAVRPRKKQPINKMIIIPTSFYGNRYCIRLVHLNGVIEQIVMDSP